MSIQRKVVENHGANEGDLRGLGVHDFIVRVPPQTRQFGEDVNNLRENKLHISSGATARIARSAVRATFVQAKRDKRGSIEITFLVFFGSF